MNLLRPTMLTALVLGSSLALAVRAQTTAFTYQGLLTVDGTPADGTFDLRFSVFDAAMGGNQAGTALTVSALSTVDGVFTASLDFGPGIFDGQPRWLQLEVKEPTDPAWEALAPRQPITSAPYAIHALEADAAPIPNGSITSAKLASGAVTAPALQTGSVGSLAIADSSIMTEDLAAGIVQSSHLNLPAFESVFWKVGGNGGLLPGVFQLGTADAQPYELIVAGERALRFEPTPSTPNLVGGWSGNEVLLGVWAATIGGGGDDGGVMAERPNRVLDNLGTIGGGSGNTAGNGIGSTDDAEWATVAGGGNNVASGSISAIGGGWSNAAGGSAAWIGGGNNNSSDGTSSAIGGGGFNRVYGIASTIAGGWGNTIDGDYATIGGGGHYGILSPANYIPDGHGTISGGSGNIAGTDNGDSSDAPFATVGGGRDNQGEGPYAFIGGGFHNRVVDRFGLIAGGSDNLAGSDDDVLDNAAYPTIAGGRNNHAFAAYASILGGQENVAFSSHAVVGGGLQNEARGDYAAIAGGWDNETNANGTGETIGGGHFNIIHGDFATVGGGENNIVITNDPGSDRSDFATIAGGSRNEVSSRGATVGGGESNRAAGFRSTIAGGIANTTAGSYAAIPGGGHNEAIGDYSLAAGRRAKALDSGSFVWADAINADLSSTGSNEFKVRATGGVYFYTQWPTLTGAVLHPGSGSWTSASSVRLKTDFRAIDALGVLARVLALEIRRWRYRAQAQGIEHLGPMAEDFRRAFGLGATSEGISTVDADGVALAAIQGLNRKLEAELERRDARILELERRLARLERLIAELPTGTATP